MRDVVSRYWRRLFGGNAQSDRQHMSRIADGRLEVLPPPSGFTPREGEVIHAEVEAYCRDDSHDLDHGGGILLVTNRAIVFLTDRKKWRFFWRRVERAGIEHSGMLQVETRSGQRFSFEVSSRSEAEATGATIDAIIGMRANKED